MNKCGIIVPRQEQEFHIEYGDYLCECLLPRVHHSSPHVFQLPGGEYVAWEDDFTCDCCEPEDSDHCYGHKKITKEEFEKLYKEASE